MLKLRSLVMLIFFLGTLVSVSEVFADGPTIMKIVGNPHPQVGVYNSYTVVFDSPALDNGIIQLSLVDLDGKRIISSDLVNTINTVTLNLDPGACSIRDFVVEAKSFTSIKADFESPQSQSQIPQWVKNTAKWWSSGQIQDPDFVEGIQYLIKKGIIIIPPTQYGSESAHKIPGWI